MTKPLDLALRIDGVPYQVKATPFDFNNEKRFKVQYDGNEYIFAFDSTIGHYASLDDDDTAIPDSLETAIAERLENFKS